TLCTGVAIDDPDVFAQLFHWMYRGELTIDSPSRPTNLLLFQLWVLAGKFEMPELQESVMSVCKARMFQKPTGVIDVDAANYAYTHTPPQSPLRLFVIDTWARNVTGSNLVDRLENLPSQFVKDLCCALVRWKEDAILNKSAIHKGLNAACAVTSGNENAQPTLPSLVKELENLPRPATAAQLEHRKVKCPTVRAHRPPSAFSTGGLTPESTTVDGDTKDETAKDMQQLQTAVSNIAL
ncbi:hypothetical protein AJ79_05995, partial [Helicocarpus griseus UAMH5409]